MVISSFSGKYEFLSNSWPVSIQVQLANGMEALAPSVEHAFQMSKSLDPVEQAQVLFSPTPDRARRIGQRVTLRRDWESVKVDIMRELLIEKFRNPNMRERLLETGDAFIIYGNNCGDTTWGAVWCGDEWEGHNLMGYLLMEIRALIREGAL